MGVTYIKGVTCLPDDHAAMQKILEIPVRAQTLQVVKEWVIEGPYAGSMDDYYMIVSCMDLEFSDTFHINEGDFLFSPKSVEAFVSRIVARASEVEFNFGIALELMGNREAKLSDSELAKKSQGRVYDTVKNTVRAVGVAKKQGLIIT